MPSREVPLVRIFLSSPGDVAEERTLARQFIDSELPKFFHLREKVKFELVAWDDPAARIPMLATETPQDSVNIARPRPANCDIVIVILWSRMGTPLPNSVRKPNGEPYLSGTEWEYEDAVHSPWQQKPVLLVYRRTAEPLISLRDPKRKEKEEQFERVEAFFAEFRSADGSLKGGVNEYAAPSDFKTLLSQHLQQFVWQLLQPSGDNGEPPPNAATIPLEYFEWLQSTCADVDLLGQDLHEGHAFTLNHVYVPAITRTVSIDDVRPLVLLGMRRTIPLLQRLDQESLYVPAPAGAGKSTFCRWAVLQSISSANIAHPVPAPADFVEPVPTNLRGRLPLLVYLRDFWTSMDCSRGRQTWYQVDLERALAAWVDASRLPGLNSGLLEAHLKTGSAFLLLDGLDEVPISESRDGATVYPRELLLSGLTNALPTWQKAGNRVLLTSRPYGLDEVRLDRLKLPSAPLELLPEPLQDLFITRWFHTLDKAEQTLGLIETIHGRRYLLPLSQNPMLLTALCVLYEGGGRLPEDRHELYKRIINTVLRNRYPGDISQREPIKARLEAIAYGMHTGEADSPRLSPAAEISYLEVERLLREFADEDSSYEYARVAPAARREELLTRSGLLLPLPNERVSFYHLSIQEFLAAERLLRTTDDLEPVFRERSAVAAWHLTLMFLFAGKIASKTPQWGSNLLGRLMTEQDRRAVKANPAPAVFIIEAVDHFIAKKYPIPLALKEDFLETIEDEKIELQTRQALGLCLGRLGDPRILDLRDPSAYVETTTGTYPCGDAGKTVEIAVPLWIGRYPVTNSQYQTFIDGGYRERRWWSEGGWAWKQRKVTEPDSWRDRLWNGPNQPVVGVSFWEAEACSQWAGGRLPRDEEWEAAARGREGFTHPWGNDWQDGICNTCEAGLGVTSPVGLFPRARQARLGIEDLAGNVWEWCGSLYNPSDTSDLDAPRVLRGGSWSNYRVLAHSAYRLWSNPNLRVNFVGFRVFVPILGH